MPPPGHFLNSNSCIYYWILLRFFFFKVAKAIHLSTKILSPLKFLYCHLQKEHTALHGNKLMPDKYVTVKLFHDYQRYPTRHAQSHLHMLASSFGPLKFLSSSVEEPWGQRLFVVLLAVGGGWELNIIYSQNKYTLHSSPCRCLSQCSAEGWRHPILLSPTFIEASFLESSRPSSFTHDSVFMLKNRKSASQVIWGGNKDVSGHSTWA